MRPSSVRGLARKVGRLVSASLAWLVVVPSPAQAQTPPAAPPAASGSAPAPARPVEIDRLLRLPAGERYGVERRAGATEQEWRSRFRLARRDVVERRKALDRLQGKLEAAATDNPWRLAPPGASASTESTENFSLTEKIRREREALAAAERRSRDLEVEANLAGVPVAWREDAMEDAPPPRAGEDAPADGVR